MHTLKHLFDRHNYAAWATLFACLTLTLLTWHSLRMQSQNNAKQQFELHVRDVLDSIQERMRQHEQILLGTVGLFDASDFVSRNDWRAYVERLNLGQNYPGIQGVGFSRILKPAELKAHIAATRTEGFPQYTVRPPGDRSLYSSIIYLEPFSGRNLAAFGFDMMSEATRAKAMRAAVERNGASISHKVKLVQETQGKVQSGLLMYLPVYRKGLPLSTVEQRWTALQGFAYSPYRVDDLMSGILGNRSIKLDFNIFDGDAQTADARMFSSSEKPRTQSARMSTLRTLNVYGNAWTIQLSSRPDFEAELFSSLPSLFLALGSGISVLLSLLMSFFITRHEKAKEMAASMTADIRSSEQKLRQSQAQIRAIVEGAEHMIISAGTDGVIRSFNGAAERRLGYKAEEVIGKLSPAVFHDREEVIRRAQELTDSGAPVEPGFEVFVARARKNPAGDTREWTYIRKDGSTFPVSLTVTALRDDSGEINAFLGIATDISAQVMAIQAQRNDETRIKAILDNVLDGIITIGERGDIESFNHSAETIFGYEAAEVIGKNVKMLMPEPYHGEHDGYLHNYVSTGHKKIIGIGRQVVGRRKDGSTFPMDLAVSEMLLGEKRIFTGIVRDITERVKIERMKSEFISTVSHELRTPLTSIRGSLALIVGGVVGELPPAAKPLVEIAHKNSERLILLVNDILDMEKIEAGKMEFDMQLVTLMPLLTQALDGNRAYGEQFKVSYELESSLPDVMIKADANRLMQVFANLLSNAAKFSPAGGKVSVSVEQIDKRVRISVKDNGSGIPDEFKGQIFQKFAQADASDTKKKGGTGLGLSITKAIIEQMGGSIGFTSQLNVLTTFFVEFPVWQKAETFTPILSGTTGRKRVLICEDDHDIAALLRLMLEQAGLAADIAYDAAQAKQLLGQQPYAVMTLDLSMPNQDGLSLIRELRADKTTAALPIVVVSANANEGRKELNGEAFSVIDWIGKPIDQVKLVEALKQAVGKVSDARSQVLHVEDDQDIAHVVTAILGESADVDNAPTLAEARRMLKAKHYDLAILDMSLPDGSGLDLLPELNSTEPAVPVMVFSASEMTHEDLSKVQSALVKSRTDNTQLLATIKRLIGDA